MINGLVWVSLQRFLSCSMHQHDSDEGHVHMVHMPDVNRAFLAGIVLNSVFVLIEFIAGFYTNSLALMSDAGHNLGDVAGLALALFAYRISKAKPTSSFTYGYSKSTILASLLNAIILLVAVGGIGLEAVKRIMHPEASEGHTIAIVAGIGIVINTVSALLFFREKEKDLNIKGAYLHLMADALVSVGVVITGVLISFTGVQWLDPLVSLIIMAVILVSTWGLLREGLKLSLDAAPGNIDIDAIRKTALSVPGVRDIHHIHVWALGTTQNAMTAHLVVDVSLGFEAIEKIKERLKHELSHVNIHHATLETEAVICEDSAHGS